MLTGDAIVPAWVVKVSIAAYSFDTIGSNGAYISLVVLATGASRRSSPFQRWAFSILAPVAFSCYIAIDARAATFG